MCNVQGCFQELFEHSCRLVWKCHRWELCLRRSGDLSAASPVLNVPIPAFSSFHFLSLCSSVALLSCPLFVLLHFTLSLTASLLPAGTQLPRGNINVLNISMSFYLCVQKSNGVQSRANIETSTEWAEEMLDEPLRQSHSSLSWGLSICSLNPSCVENDLKYLHGSLRRGWD